MKSSRMYLLAGTAALAITLGGPASAHEDRLFSAGGKNYIAFVGWWEEPAFEDEANRFVIYTRECNPANLTQEDCVAEAHGPNTIIQPTLTFLKIERQGSSGAKVFSAQQLAAKALWDENDGSTSVPVAPTKDGTYRFTISGTLGDAVVDHEVFTCEAPAAGAEEPFDCVKDIDTVPTTASKYQNN